MNNFFLKALLFASIATVIFAGCNKKDFKNNEHQLYSDTELKISDLVNAHRVEKGLAKLELDRLIWIYAKEHIPNQIENKQISHDTFSSVPMHSYENRATENIAYGYANAQAIVTGWLNSEENRKKLKMIIV